MNDSSAQELRFRQRRFLWLGLMLLVVGTALRIPGVFTDLWLDEIWSLKITQQVSSPIDVFTKLHHEINHYFNTLYLWYVGNHGNWPGYRIPSLIAGSCTVGLAGLIGRRRDPTSAIMAMMVMGFSYVLIVYSSEARGYAMVVFCSFLCYYALDCYLEKPRWRWAVLYSLAAIFGLASDIIFANTLLAALAWSGYRWMKCFSGWKQVVVGVLSCHAAPVLFLGMLYWVDIRHIVAGGGTPSPSLIHSYGTALAWALGTPAADLGKFLSCLAAIAVFYFGVRQLWRGNSDAPVFFVGVILAFPILLTAVRGSDAIYTRHFLIGMAFLLILFSFVLASLYDRGGRGRIICLFLFALYFLMNGANLLTFFQYGRGHYGEAVQFMAGHSEKPVVTIGSDHDFRIPTTIEFYAPQTIGSKTIRYYRTKSWPTEGPEWVVLHKESFEAPVPPLTELVDGGGNRYDLLRTFPTAPLVGLHWFVYHNRGTN